MLSKRSNALKKTKKKYINILKNTDITSYHLHEKMSNRLNRSSASAALDTTASRSNLTRSQINSYHKLPVNENEKNAFKITKCSYTDFLALREKKITTPFNYTEDRFKWQNLNNANNLIDPSLYTRPHKKQFLLRETFGEGMLDFINREQLPNNRPRIRRLRRYSNEMGNNIQNVSLEISRRVINPEFNEEPVSYRKHKRSLSQTSAFLHRTTGEISSLFDLTPVNVENKNKKKLFEYKSYGAECINIFSKDYPERDLPSHTKRLFFENRCHFDTLKCENLVFDIDNFWKSEREYDKKKRNWSLDEKYISKKVYSLKHDCDTLNLRNIKYQYSLNNWNNRSLGRIKRK